MEHHALKVSVLEKWSNNVEWVHILQKRLSTYCAGVVEYTSASVVESYSASASVVEYTSASVV